MLSDQEREALTAIERGLHSEDPGWAMAFDLSGQQAARQRRFELAFHLVAAVVAAALSVFLVVANAPGPALFFAAIAAGLFWLVRRLRRADRSHGTDPSARPVPPGDVSGATPV